MVEHFVEHGHINSLAGERYLILGGTLPPKLSVVCETFYETDALVALFPSQSKMPTRHVLFSPTSFKKRYFLSYLSKVL